MNHIESSKGSPAESDDTGIDRESAIMTERGEINNFDSFLLGSPAPFATFDLQVEFTSLAKSEIRGQNGYAVAAFDEATRKSTHLNNRPTLFLERIIGLHDF